MSTRINPLTKGLDEDAILMRDKTDTIVPIKTMGNVRRENYNNSFAKVVRHNARPEYSSETRCIDNNMNQHRHSDPTTSQTNATIKEAVNPKNHRKFRGPVGDSLLSTTSLILASSSTLLDTATYVEKTFINRSTSIEDLWIKSHDYKFENLVFEGGGSKGLAYVGALQILEEMGLLKNMKRFAGASVGAMVATLAAVGYTSSELLEFLDEDLQKLMVDHSCGYCSLLPNLLKGFGWNPGMKMNNWLGEQLKDRTGDCNITFKEVLRHFGTEICIVVTNLSHMTVEYFHPKTTPNTPVRKAVQMSMALPGVYQVVRETFNDQEDVYVDGGLLCNYPIHAFDGWWLSLHPDDTFFKRLHPLEDFARLYEKSERFGTWNSKTLGIVLYSNTETELMKTLLSARLGNKPVVPITKLSKQRLKLERKQQKIRIEHEYMVNVVGRFILELEKNNLDEDSIINEEEFRAVFENPINLLPGDLDSLFGENCEVMQAFAQLDRDNDGEITFQELMAFLEKKGVNLQNRFLGYSRREIKNLGDFVQTLQVALAVNVKRVYVEKRDVDRTIGIDTGYIETNDFKMEPADKQFLIEAGKSATRAFLYEHIKKQTQCDCDTISPSGIIAVQQGRKTMFEYESQQISSGCSSTSSYKSITPIG